MPACCTAYRGWKLIINSLDEARIAIRTWLKPPPILRPESQLSLQPSRSLLRNLSTASRPESIISSPAPARSHSHSALISLDTGRTTPALPAPQFRPLESAKLPQPGPAFPLSKVQPIDTAPSDPQVRLPALTITSPTSPKRISFPILQSPSKATSATYTDPVLPSLTPSSPTRHRVSGGRFSILWCSGILSNDEHGRSGIKSGPSRGRLPSNPIIRKANPATSE